MILRRALQGRPGLATVRRPSGRLLRLRPALQLPRQPTGQPRVTLIIGGGIAAYKALDLIRRLKERHIHVRCVLTKAAQQFVTPLVRQRAVARARLYRSVRSRERVRRRPYPSRARLRPDRGGACDRRPDGEDGAGPCRRSRQRHPARGQPADPAGAGDEPADVEQRRDPPQRRCSSHATASPLIGPNAGEMAEAGEAGVGRMAEATGNRSCRRAHPAPAAAAPARRQARADHRRPDP